MFPPDLSKLIMFAATPVVLTPFARNQGDRHGAAGLIINIAIIQIIEYE